MDQLRQRIFGFLVAAVHSLLWAVCSCALFMPPPVAADSLPETAVPFDAARAWMDFDVLLRENYGYFQRPGVDGDRILAQFKAAALQAATREQFIEVLKLVAHNFADPHFVVGPGAATDYSIIPTSSDLYARQQNDRFVIVDVRTGSDAQAQGVAIGAVVVQVDGLAPQTAVEKTMGRPFAQLSAAQIDMGINIALAGVKNRPRELLVRAGGHEQRYVLRPTAELANAVNQLPKVSLTWHDQVAVIRFNNSVGDIGTIALFREALEAAMHARAIVLDFRNTPSGGNTVVARGIMGHFVERDTAYQVHVVPNDERVYGVPRKFAEYVLPIAPHYGGPVVTLGGRWTGSMGEGLMIGFRAIGARTAGSPLAHLLGGMFNEELASSGARVDLAEEQLFDVLGAPREDFLPDLLMEASEAESGREVLLDATIRQFGLDR